MNITANTPMAEMAGRECERLQKINADLLAALQALSAGFVDGSIKWAKPRQADSDPYDPANVLMSAAIARATEEEEMKTRLQIAGRLAAIASDDRYHAPLARVDVNAPLALI